MGVLSVSSLLFVRFLFFLIVALVRPGGWVPLTCWGSIFMLWLLVEEVMFVCRSMGFSRRLLPTDSDGVVLDVSGCADDVEVGCAYVDLRFAFEDVRSRALDICGRFNRLLHAVACCGPLVNVTTTLVFDGDDGLGISRADVVLLRLGDLPYG